MGYRNQDLSLGCAHFCQSVAVSRWHWFVFLLILFHIIRNSTLGTHFHIFASALSLHFSDVQSRSYLFHFSYQHPTSLITPGLFSSPVTRCREEKIRGSSFQRLQFKSNITKLYRPPPSSFLFLWFHCENPDFSGIKILAHLFSPASHVQSPQKYTDPAITDHLLLKFKIPLNFFFKGLLQSSLKFFQSIFN